MSEQIFQVLEHEMKRHSEKINELSTTVTKVKFMSITTGVLVLRLVAFGVHASQPKWNNRFWLISLSILCTQSFINLCLWLYLAGLMQTSKSFDKPSRSVSRIAVFLTILSLANNGVAIANVVMNESSVLEFILAILNAVVNSIFVMYGFYVIWKKRDDTPVVSNMDLLSTLIAQLPPVVA